MANTKTLTGANAVLMLGVTDYFPTAQQIQGFAMDDVFDFPEIKPAEVQSGVDGNMSAGYVYVPVPQSITLQGDSASIDFFDQWWSAQKQQDELYFGFGIVRLPSIGRSYALIKGVLTSYKPSSEVKKLLQPRKFEITWQDIVIAPI